MKLEDDLTRVLWHEMGHLCSGIMKIEKYPEYKVTNFSVNFEPRALGYKWAGSVTTKPSIKYVELVKDKNFASYSILGTMSGCVFETIFFNEIFGIEIKFDDLFCSKPSCSGNGDYQTMRGINYQISKLYGYKLEYINYIEIEYSKIIYDIIINDLDFVHGFNEICIKNKDLIFYNCNEKNLKGCKFELSGKQLDVMIDDLSKLIERTNFRENFNHLIELLYGKMPN